MHNNFGFAEEIFFKMVDFLKTRESLTFDLSELEDFLQKDGRELLKQLLLSHLEERGVGDVGQSVVGIDGIKRNHKRIGTRKIKTLFGEINIKRMGYSSRKVSTLFPLDGSLNLPTSDVSYNLQRHLILEVIKSSFDESIESIERWTGVKIKKGQVNKIIIDASTDFEEFYDSQNVKVNKTANELPLIILTSDGKGILMRYEDLREETKKRANAKRQIQHSNKKGEVTENKKIDAKRMSTVASIYEIDRYIRIPEDINNEFFQKENLKEKRERPLPKSKRVWASLEKKGEEVIKEMFDEALLRDPLNKKEWVVLVDGDSNQIKKFKKFAQMFNVKITIICDIIHVLQYIWKAGKALISDEKKIDKWVSEKLIQILEGKSSLVASGIRRSATNRKMKKSKREPIDSCAKYLLNHSDYLHYNDYLKGGYPIATGIVEGACRYLVKDRMGITGARWSLKGAEALLKLRAIKISGDFSSYWKFYEQKQYERNYQRLYSNPSILMNTI